MGVQIETKSALKDVTLSLDTSAYADGDVLAATQEITHVFDIDGGTGIWQSAVVIDKDDQGQAFDIWLLGDDVSIGTENAAVSVSDANAAYLLGKVSIASGDYYDAGGVRVATKAGSDLGFLVQAAADSRSLFVAAVSRGTGTYTASGIVLRLGFLRDA